MKETDFHFEPFKIDILDTKRELKKAPRPRVDFSDPGDDDSVDALERKQYERWDSVARNEPRW